MRIKEEVVEIVNVFYSFGYAESNSDEVGKAKKPRNTSGEHGGCTCTKNY